VGLASGVLSSSRYVGSIVASLLLPVLVDDDGDGVTTMLAVSTAALILSIGAAANLPSLTPSGSTSEPTLSSERSGTRNSSSSEA
jgi:hypothetical protein